MAIFIGIKIGIPNNNQPQAGDIPDPPDSLYRLEDSLFNYKLESGLGNYRLEQLTIEEEA